MGEFLTHHADDVLALMISILGIVGFTLIAIVRIIMKADERKLELKLRLKQSSDAATISAIEQLRAEIAVIWDSGSQYDLSLDNTMHRMERRIEFLEGQIRSSVRTSSQEAESVQRVGQNL